jgi:hypothetical protein
MKRQQHSTTISTRQILKVFGMRAPLEKRCRKHFGAIETLRRILFQSLPVRGRP